MALGRLLSLAEFHHYVATVVLCVTGRWSHRSARFSATLSPHAPLSLFLHSPLPRWVPQQQDPWPWLHLGASVCQAARLDKEEGWGRMGVRSPAANSEVLGRCVGTRDSRL